MEDIFSDLNAPKEKEPETIWDTVDGTQTMSSENYGSSVDQDINMPTYKERSMEKLLLIIIIV